MEESDYFRESFKFYKRKNVPDVLKSVIDLELENTNYSILTLETEMCVTDPHADCTICLQLGLIPHSSWKVHSLQGYPGLFIVKNPFSVDGQQHWIQKCLELYPRKPSVTNLDLHHKNVDDPMKQGYIDKLCWVTLGFHHNWDTKEYNSSHYSDFPECLASLSKHVATCLGFKTFKPEAAIVNYYGRKSSLGIHNDYSEEELNEPIISFSFGQTAIFLVGTSIRTEKPVPIFLRSGDIIILSSASRLAYHAVPAIIQEPVDHRFNNRLSDFDDSWKVYNQFINEHRLNISVRQVYHDVSAM